MPSDRRGHRGGVERHEDKSLLAQVALFFEQNQESRFKEWDDTCLVCNGTGLAPSPVRGMEGTGFTEDKVCPTCNGSKRWFREVRDKAGYRKFENGRWIYYVYRETFKQEVIKGFAEKSACKTLIERKVLLPEIEQNPETGKIWKRSTRRERLPIEGNDRVYVIDPAALSREE